MGKMWLVFLLGVSLAFGQLDGDDGGSAGNLDGDSASNANELDGDQPSGGSPPGDSTADECAAFTCYALDECPYEADGEGEKPWQEIADGKFSHPVTGIRKPAEEGSAYMATYVLAEGSASMASAEGEMAADRNFLLTFYEAVNGHTLEVCCDEACEEPAFASDVEASPDQYNAWQEAEFSCPAGTTQINVRCRSVEGAIHRGACGVAKIDMVDGDGNSLCGDQPADEPEDEEEDDGPDGVLDGEGGDDYYGGLDGDPLRRA